MAELGPALFMFLLMIVFPLINLLGLASGAATVSLIATEAASHAANSSSFADAESSVQQVSANLLNSGFGRFAKLQPAGGLNNSGVDIFINITPVNGGSGSSVGPNAPLTGSVDANKNLYEYSIRVSYLVQPFISMRAVPFIGNVPGLGAPFNLSWSVARSVEFPPGLLVNQSSGAGGGYPGSQGGGGNNGLMPGGQ